MGFEREDEQEETEGRLQGEKDNPLITSIYRYLAFRLAIGGTVGLLLSVLLCVEGIYQGFNLELWILAGVLISVSLLVSLFSWRWLFLHRRSGYGNGGASPPDSI